MHQKPSFADWTAIVERTVAHSEHYGTLRLRVTSDFPEVQPGQFVMIETGRGLDPYLRRAFSVATLSREENSVLLGILIKAVGRGTRNLMDAHPGERVRIMGPLGHGFNNSPAEPEILVAGGVGVAPLLMLATTLADQGKPFDFYYGGRSRNDLPRLTDVRALTEEAGGRLVVTTEDGTEGIQGLVTAPLLANLEKGDKGRIYTCGPNGLMKALATLAEQFGLSGEAALETDMGCGFGACLGCVVQQVDGTYALCCKNGPVFRFEEIQW